MQRAYPILATRIAAVIVAEKAIVALRGASSSQDQKDIQSFCTFWYPLGVRNVSAKEFFEISKVSSENSRRILL